MLVNKSKMQADLIYDEGMELKAYKDHLGFLTIGVGRLIDGRKGGGLTEQEALYLLNNDIEKCERWLSDNLPWFNAASEPRQRGLINMAFQLGFRGLLGFKNSLKLMSEGNWVEAGDNLRQSLWYKQTPKRAERVIKLIVNG